MPNWCSGNIRFRGAGKDILLLLQNEFVGVGTNPETLVIEEYPIDVTTEYGDVVLTVPDRLDRKLFKSLYIKGTRRNFIDGTVVEAYGYYDEDDEDERTILIFEGFKAAWAIKAEPYVEMAKKYNVDIHIFGWECGMEFAQEIEIVNGELVKDEEIQYEDWDWECPMAYEGG